MSEIGEQKRSHCCDVISVSGVDKDDFGNCSACGKESKFSDAIFPSEAFHRFWWPDRCCKIIESKGLKIGGAIAWRAECSCGKTGMTNYTADEHINKNNPSLNLISPGDKEFSEIYDACLGKGLVVSITPTGDEDKEEYKDEGYHYLECTLIDYVEVDAYFETKWTEIKYNGEGKTKEEALKNAMIAYMEDESK